MSHLRPDIISLGNGFPFSSHSVRALRSPWRMISNAAAWRQSDHLGALVAPALAG